MEKEYLYNSSLIPSNIKINNEFIFGKEKIIIAEPCTFANHEEAYSIAKELKKLGIKFFRTGAYKGRTNSYIISRFAR